MDETLHWSAKEAESTQSTVPKPTKRSTSEGLQDAAMKQNDITSMRIGDSEDVDAELREAELQALRLETLTLERNAQDSLRRLNRILESFVLLPEHQARLPQWKLSNQPITQEKRAREIGERARKFLRGHKFK